MIERVRAVLVTEFGNALLIKRQAEASAKFAESMNLMAREIGRTFGEMDLSKTQAEWEKAVAQAGSMEERMEVFLDSMEQSAISGGTTSAKEELVSDEEIDRMIQADVLAAEKQELGKLYLLKGDFAASAESFARAADAAGNWKIRAALGLIRVAPRLTRTLYARALALKSR